MDGNNWRTTQGQVQIPGQVVGGESVASASGMEGGDWRSQLQQDSRQRIVKKIMETLKRHLPFSGQEGLHELQKIAVRFEEKIYAAATCQSDYLRKISVKMLTMESKSQNSTASSVQSNPASGSKNPQDPGASQSMPSQMQNQVQQLPVPSQNRPQVLSQNIPNNIASAVVPNSSGLASTLPPVSGMSSVPGHNSSIQNIQSMPNVNPNVVGNSTGQGLSSNIYVNPQRQVQGRQHVGTQDQQQQPQNSHYLYNQPLQHQLMKQTYQQGGVLQSMMPSQIQQQQQHNLLQQNQLHSSQQAVMQTSLRQPSASSTLQNQQSTQSRLQPQSLSVLRQQQPQSSIVHQKQTSQQQSQQQQVSGQQPNTAKLQQNQLTSQQNNVIDEQQQQQRIITQQNNVSNMQQQQAISQQHNLANMHQQQSTGQPNNIQNMHQQQLGPQTNLSSFQQQHSVGVQHGNSSLTTATPVQMIQQSKIAVSQQMQQSVVNMLPNQVQQSQSHSMQQQLIGQIQPQQGQLQQQLGLQQKRIPTSTSLLQQQTMIDQQKQLMQSERAAPEFPPNSSSHTGNMSSGDWQEETYQMIKNMNEMYFAELNEMFQRLSAKLLHVATLAQQPKSDQLEKLKRVTNLLDQLLKFLLVKRNDIQPMHKEKLAYCHKQINNMINSNRPRKPAALLQQGQLAQLHTTAAQQSSQQLAQISQKHMNDGQMNSQMQQMNAQGSIASTQQNSLPNLQHNSLSSGVSNSRQNMMVALQPGLHSDPGQGNALNQMQQVSMNSMQQNSVSSPQQMSINSMSSQSGITTLQSNIKQDQQVFSTQQIKHQYQPQQMHQQLMHRQQLLHQQQPLAISTQQMLQHNQMNDTNDIKIRHQMGVKPGALQAHSISGQRYQQLKPGVPFATSPKQVLQASSPQIGQHPSPQVDQQNLLTSHSKAGTPLQSANSPYIVPSPSTSLAPSPMPGDYEKTNHGVSSLSNAVHQSTTAASVSNQSVAIGTPGISASPLLAEFTSPEGTHGVASTVVSGDSNVVGLPLERLTKVVKAMSSKALSAAVSDISSVVNMIDRITGSALGNGTRAAVGEDLVVMTKCRLQDRKIFTLDGPTGIKRMRRHIHATPFNVVSSTGSGTDDFRHFNDNESDGESTGASSIKRPRIEAIYALEEELKEINRKLIDTVVSISEDYTDPTAVASAEGGEGTVVKCSFSAVALCPNLELQYATAQMTPIQPLRLLIPRNYPNSSPVILDKLPVEVSKEFEDLTGKAKSRFSISLRTLQEPISLLDVVRTWDTSARSVISEYFERSGGGSFSSKYGAWENCVVTAV